MPISFVKIRHFLCVMLFFPLLSKAEKSSAPPKFYEGLQREAQKIASHYYFVQRHERLSTIAARYQLNSITLAQWNNILAPYQVEPGQRLKLVGLKTFINSKTRTLNSSKNKVTQTTHTQTNSAQKIYVVTENDTLYSIALRFKVSPEQLATWNNSVPPYTIALGQKLKIFKNKQKHSSSDLVKKPLEIVEKVEDNLQKTSIISINNKNMLKLYCQWPTQGEVIKNFAQTQGRGIEIKGVLGQVIRAIAAGKVVTVGTGLYGHGDYVVIKHKDTYLSLYLNNKRILVTEGQNIAQGQVIAEMGQVGHQSPALRLEITKNSNLVDPLWVLPK